MGTAVLPAAPSEFFSPLFEGAKPDAIDIGSTMQRAGCGRDELLASQSLSQAQRGKCVGQLRHVWLSITSRSLVERGVHDPPTTAHCPCGRTRPNNSLALWARYPNWSNPIVQDPSMFGSKFLFPWQVCLSSKSAWGVCVCIYSLYYKGVRKSKFLTKFAPYVAIIMCHFGLGLTLPSKGKRRGEKRC